MAMYFDEGDQPQPLSSTVPGIAPVAPPMMQNMGAYQQQGDLYRQFLHPYGAPQQTPFETQQAQPFQPSQANMQSLLDQRNQQSMLDQYRAQNNIPETQYNPMTPRPVGLDDSGMGAGAAPLTQQQFMNNMQGAGLSFGAPGLGAAAQSAMANQNRNPYQQQGPMPALQSAFTQPPVAAGGIGSLNQSQPPSSLSQTSNSNQGASSDFTNLASKTVGPNGATTGSSNQQQARIVGGNGVM